MHFIHQDGRVETVNDNAMLFPTGDYDARDQSSSQTGLIRHHYPSLTYKFRPSNIKTTRSPTFRTINNTTSSDSAESFVSERLLNANTTMKQSGLQNYVTDSRTTNITVMKNSTVSTHDSASSSFVPRRRQSTATYSKKKQTKTKKPAQSFVFQHMTPDSFVESLQKTSKEARMEQRRKNVANKTKKKRKRSRKEPAIKRPRGRPRRQRSKASTEKTTRPMSPPESDLVNSSQNCPVSEVSVPETVELPQISPSATSLVHNFSNTTSPLSQELLKTPSEFSAPPEIYLDQLCDQGDPNDMFNNFLEIGFSSTPSKENARGILFPSSASSFGLHGFECALDCVERQFTTAISGSPSKISHRVRSGDLSTYENVIRSYGSSPLHLDFIAIGSSSTKRTSGMRSSASTKTPFTAMYTKYVCISPSPMSTTFRRRAPDLTDVTIKSSAKASASASSDITLWTTPSSPGIFSSVLKGNDNNAYSSVFSKMVEQEFPSDQKSGIHSAVTQHPFHETATNITDLQMNSELDSEIIDPSLSLPLYSCDADQVTKPLQENEDSIPPSDILSAIAPTSFMTLSWPSISHEDAFLSSSPIRLLHSQLEADMHDIECLDNSTQSSTKCLPTAELLATIAEADNLGDHIFNFACSTKLPPPLPPLPHHISNGLEVEDQSTHGPLDEPSTLSMVEGELCSSELSINVASSGSDSTREGSPNVPDLIKSYSEADLQNQLEELSIFAPTQNTEQDPSFDFYLQVLASAHHRRALVEMLKNHRSSSKKIQNHGSLVGDLVWSIITDAPANPRNKGYEDHPKCMFPNCIYSVLGFWDGSELASHITAYHATRKDLSCDFCHRHFIRRGTLNKHMATGDHDDNILVAKAEPRRELNSFVRSGFTLLPDSLCRSVDEMLLEVKTENTFNMPARADSEWTLHDYGNNLSDSESEVESVSDSEVEDILDDLEDPDWIEHEGSTSDTESDDETGSECDSELYNNLEEIFALYSENELKSARCRYANVGRFCTEDEESVSGDFPFVYRKPEPQGPDEAYFLEAGTVPELLPSSLKAALRSEFAASKAMNMHMLTSKFGSRPVTDLLAKSSRPAVSNLIVEDQTVILETKPVRRGFNSLRQIPHPSRSFRHSTVNPAHYDII